MFRAITRQSLLPIDAYMLPPLTRLRFFAIILPLDCRRCLIENVIRRISIHQRYMLYFAITPLLLYDAAFLLLLCRRYAVAAVDAASPLRCALPHSRRCCRHDTPLPPRYAATMPPCCHYFSLIAIRDDCRCRRPPCRQRRLRYAADIATRRLRCCRHALRLMLLAARREIDGYNR